MKKILLVLSISLLLAAGCNQAAAPFGTGLPDTHTGTSTIQAQYEALPAPSPAKPVSLPVPEKPSLTFVQGAQPYVQINWNYEIAEQFNVYRSTDPNSGWQVLFANFPSSGHTAVDSDLPTDSRTLYYRITSVDAAGHESAPSVVASVELPAREPIDNRPICPKLGPITSGCRPVYR